MLFINSGEKEVEKHTFSFIDMYSNPKTMELTPCERKILEEYGKGKSTKSIADKLCCSIFTVNSHRQNIMHKMEIKEMSEFRFIAVSLHLKKMAVE